jgi:hypothetical protein
MPASSCLRGEGMACRTVCTASTRCSLVWHTPRYYAGRHLPCHASRPPSSPHARPRLSTAPHSRQKAVRRFLGGGVSRKTPKHARPAGGPGGGAQRWPPPRMAIRCQASATALARSPSAARLPQAGTRPSPAPPTTRLREGRPRAPRAVQRGLRPRSHDGCDTPWGTQVGRGGEDRPHV